MNKILKYIVCLTLILPIITGCQALKDGLEGNKKTKRAEEFLIKKNNPLVMPPDYSKLPLPENSKNLGDSNQDFDLKKVLKKNPSKSETNNQSQTNQKVSSSKEQKIHDQSYSEDMPSGRTRRRRSAIS